MKNLILAIDAGTTGITVRVYDRDLTVVHRGYREFPQYFPRPGWVEHDAQEIWQVTRALLCDAIQAQGASNIAAIGITNQRETVVLWDAATGNPVHRAIVWQCRRTADLCESLRRAGHEDRYRCRTGLVLDAYFSGTKLRWLLDQVPGLERRAQAGELRAGTIDTWLLHRLTGGLVHATDPTNASRTLLYDIHERRFHPELLGPLGLPASLLPEVRHSADDFGSTALGTVGAEIPISALIGDQQSALFGQGCVAAGDVKITYGTGCFILLNTGSEARASRHGLLTTLACDARGGPIYALEGSVFVGGAAVQWLRDGLGLIREAAETQGLAESVPDSGGVYLVPAFVGLGAPYWDSEARGLICGLTRGTTRAHLARAVLEGIACSCRDVVAAMAADLGRPPARLAVDGGATANDFLMQFQADTLDLELHRPADIETTSLGAARLAAIQAGLIDPAAVGFPRGGRVFRPRMTAEARTRLLSGWDRAVRLARAR